MRRSQLLFDSCNFPTDHFQYFLRDMGIPGHDLTTIDDALQQRFFQKDKETGQPLERWELKEVELNCPRARILQHLGNCGFLYETKPTGNHYTYAAWPGALAPRAAARFKDLWNVYLSGTTWQSTIVFGSKRPLQPDKESFTQCCIALGLDHLNPFVVDAWEFLNPQTELDMMRFMWQASSIHRPIFWKAIFVNAPMKPPAMIGGPPVRPNTEDTIKAWLQSRPVPGTMLLSSGAPYGMAQDEAFRFLLEPDRFVVDTFGHSAPDLPIETFMREVAGCVHRIRITQLGS